MCGFDLSLCTSVNQANNITQCIQIDKETNKLMFLEQDIHFPFFKNLAHPPSQHETKTSWALTYRMIHNTCVVQHCMYVFPLVPAATIHLLFPVSMAIYLNSTGCPRKKKSCFWLIILHLKMFCWAYHNACTKWYVGYTTHTIMHLLLQY